MLFNTEKPRPYERHHWIVENNREYCYVCGISEKRWQNKIALAPMSEWDCATVRARKTAKRD